VFFAAGWRDMKPYSAAWVGHVPQMPDTLTDVVNYRYAEAMVNTKPLSG
jgi:hypothetical protein